MVKNKNNGESKSKFVPICHICGKPGHFAPNCHQRKKKGIDQSGGGHNNIDSNDTNEVTMFCGYTAVPVLTDNSPHIEKWLLDSGPLMLKSYTM